MTIAIREAPFYSQKWNLTDWKNLGFESYDDAEHWQRSSCGILCLKMAIDAAKMANGKPLSLPIVEFIKKGIAFGAYSADVGWTHDGLVLIAKDMGFEALRKEHVSIDDLVQAIKEGFLPIVSIKWAFESRKSLKERIFLWKKPGGHLALVVGYEETENEIKALYVHHTSVREEYNWKNKYITPHQFEEGFTGRCIFVKVS